VPAATRSVVHPGDVEPTWEGSAEVRVTLDEANGCELLEQRILRIPRGRSAERTPNGRHELLYVVAGRGTLGLKGGRHALEPETGAFVAEGETYAVDADDELTLLSVLVPAEERPEASRKVTVRFADQPELRATSKRTFRYLVSSEIGCTDATQFLGIVQPSKEGLHSHPYEEVGYIVEGDGVAHIDGEETPLRTGSCFHLAPAQVHTIESSGPEPMRIVGVFSPAGSPAARLDPDNN
jgi:quercetin dioxygenase-like cupin family protein